MTIRQSELDFDPQPSLDGCAAVCSAHAELYIQHRWFRSLDVSGVEAEEGLLELRFGPPSQSQSCLLLAAHSHSLGKIRSDQELSGDKKDHVLVDRAGRCPPPPPSGPGWAPLSRPLECQSIGSKSQPGRIKGQTFHSRCQGLEADAQMKILLQGAYTVVEKTADKQRSRLHPEVSHGRDIKTAMAGEHLTYIHFRSLLMEVAQLSPHHVLLSCWHPNRSFLLLFSCYGMPFGAPESVLPTATAGERMPRCHLPG
ncbi:uncharacterized protein LOC119543866 [Choloepus didactylus]|uniref:uncharacterized protein LOC119543866 n=1 Tax=Choloepus didactylus TaxID=27675 RepID=UPI00189F79E8|nr:uncharacterized protein LOC119543866 [Choloepus didactylus]